MRAAPTVAVARRRVIAALACWPAVRALAAQDAGTPRHKVSVRTLHQALATRFPLRFDFGGLLQLDVSAPRLHLLPSRNRLGAGLRAEASGLPLRQPVAGDLDALFSLRYERRDRTVRAHDAEVLELRLPGLPTEVTRGLREALPPLLREGVGEIVLHTVSPADLAVAHTLGFEPETITVVDDGLVIGFGPKPAR